jgi:hypothetical protein
MKVRFDKTLSTTFAEIRKLNAVGQRQILETLQIRNGSLFPDIETCARALREEFDVDDENLELDHYTITREGEVQPSHEMWVYFGEHGLVFELGAEYATPIHCVQSHFWSVDDEDVAATELAEALNETVPF